MPGRLSRIENWEKLAKKAEYSPRKLAKLCKVSTRSLERHFAEAKKRPPRHWLNEIRQQAALELIKEGFSIKEAAHELAYKQASHFSREFKVFHGVPPSVIFEVNGPMSRLDTSCRDTISFDASKLR